MSENMIRTTITCPHCNGEVIIERPAPIKRGMLLGLELADMTPEQLKREKINAGSVLYKATKRNAPAELIARNQARFDAVVAMMEEKGISRVSAKVAEGTTVANAVESTEVAETVTEVESTEETMNLMNELSEEE